MLQLVGGVFWLNLVFVLVGYCCLSAFLRGRSAADWGSFAGVALFIGAGLVGLALSILVVVGLSSSLPVFGATAGTLAALGLAAGVMRPQSIMRTAADARLGKGASAAEHWLAAASAGAIVAMCCVVLLAGFRSSPWLDDAWTFYLPKGIELSRAGLDQRLFVPNSDFVAFTGPDRPLWWSVIGGLDVSAVGHIDLRAINGQMAVFYVAFAAAVTRLLWVHVRRAILLPAVLLALAAPELTAHTQSGGADLPLAFFLALGLLAASLWLTGAAPLLFFVFVVCTATALNTKNEATILVVGFLLVGACFAWAQIGWRYLIVVAGAALGLATLIPWLAWTRLHGVSNEALGPSELNPLHLWQTRDRLEPALRAVTHQMLEPRRWFLAVPLLVGASLALAVRERRLAWLGPPAMVGVGLALLVWIYWAGSVELTFWLDTSAYRVVDSVMVATAIALPLVLERLLSSRPARGKLGAAGDHTEI
jgi:energy-coupling factor transporter transmembrane protein EcfT